MRKFLLSLILAFSMIASTVPCVALAAENPDGNLSVSDEPEIVGGLENFQKQQMYTNGQFSDIPSTLWCAENVATVYELGLMNGTSDTTFSPDGNITLGSALAIAARIHKIYHTGSADFVQGDPWYQEYADYAFENGILERGFANYSKAATRAEFAGLLAKALPAEALTPENMVTIEMIPDVSYETPNAEEICALYQAGVLTGNDVYGTFTPNTTIKRSAAAAIVGRMVKPELRRLFVLEEKPIPITGISLNITNTTVEIGGKMSLWPTIFPENSTNRSLTWTSSNSAVVSVEPVPGSVSANIYGVSAGTAVITVTGGGKAATCKVTVKKGPAVGAPIPSELMSDGSGLGFYTNSADGVTVLWAGENKSGKTVNYYTCHFSMYNPVGDPAYDYITGRHTAKFKVVGPVAPGSPLVIYDVIGYTSVCSTVVLTQIDLEYADGTRETVPYGYQGGETLWDEYNNNWISGSYW